MSPLNPAIARLMPAEFGCFAKKSTLNPAWGALKCGRWLVPI